MAKVTKDAIIKQLQKENEELKKKNEELLKEVGILTGKLSFYEDTMKNVGNCWNDVCKTVLNMAGAGIK